MFRSLVSIQGPEGYGPSTLPLRHSEGIEPRACLVQHMNAGAILPYHNTLTYICLLDISQLAWCKPCAGFEHWS